MKEFFCDIVPGFEYGMPCWLVMAGWQHEDGETQFLPVLYDHSKMAAEKMAAELCQIHGNMAISKWRSHE